MKKRSIIILTVLMVVLGALTVLAAEFDQKITATIGGVLEVTVPADKAWALEVKDDNKLEAGAVAVNSNLPWTLEITNENGGYFKKGNTELAKPLYLELGSEDPKPMTSDITLQNSVLGPQSYDVTFHQEVLITDLADSYTIDIVYTVTHDID